MEGPIPARVYSTHSPRLLDPLSGCGAPRARRCLDERKWLCFYTGRRAVTRACVSVCVRLREREYFKIHLRRQTTLIKISPLHRATGRFCAGFVFSSCQAVPPPRVAFFISLFSHQMTLLAARFTRARRHSFFSRVLDPPAIPASHSLDLDGGDRNLQTRRARHV